MIENTSEQRLEICKNCENLKPFVDIAGEILQQCSVCKCLVFFKTKVPSATCPIGKW
jgi:hypothetical protein